MEIIERVGREDLAVVYVARTGDGRVLEFVEALVPPRPREEKWVLIVSSLFGCPVGCLMCDSGTHYNGKVPESVLLAQIDHLVHRRYPTREIPVRKWKVHFARMGDPSFNPDVNRVLCRLPGRYRGANLIPSISTVAPRGTERFFEELLDVRRECFPDGDFQLQFSIHATDEAARDELIPVPKWDFTRISRYGERFFCGNARRKVTLNFAASTSYPVDPAVVADHFDPGVFLVKITPLNPSASTARHRLESLVSLDPADGKGRVLVERFERFGFEVILSIGEPEENRIGSNCGLRVARTLGALP